MSAFFIIPSDSDLMHHGVMGQRWGVRRYQNKNGTLTLAGRRRLGIGGPTLDSESSSSSGRASSSSGKSNSGKKEKYYDAKEGRDWRWADDNPGSKGTAKSSNKGAKTKKSKGEPVDATWRKADESGTKKTGGSSTSKLSADKFSGALSTTSSLSKSLASYEERKLKKDKARVMKGLDVSKMSDEDLKKAISRMSTEDTYKRLTADHIEYGRQKTIERLQFIGDVTAVGTSVVGLYAAIQKARKR